VTAALLIERTPLKNHFRRCLKQQPIIVNQYRSLLRRNMIETVDGMIET
jgi:hypothetical protein